MGSFRVKMCPESWSRFNQLIVLSQIIYKKGLFSPFFSTPTKKKVPTNVVGSFVSRLTKML